MAEVHVDIDTRGWTQHSIAYIYPVAYNLLWNAGDDIDPRVEAIAGGHRISVTDPTCDVATVLTAETITTRYNEWLAAWEAARLLAEAEATAAQAEVDANVITPATLDTIDATIDGLSNLEDVKVFVKALTNEHLKKWITSA